jgi:drug/metabolite transporter (DMT)-like permease
MSGTVWAVIAGVGFGVFQPLNRRVNRELDPYACTFLVLAMGAVLVIGLSLLTSDLSLLPDAPVSAAGWFALAGVIQFAGGWTMVSLSQRRDGAAKTGAAAGAMPVISTLLAAIFLAELPTIFAVLGVLLVVAGVMTLSFRNETGITLSQVPWFGVLAATCWALSPVFVRLGREGLPDPLLGVAIGFLAAFTVYAVSLAATGRWRHLRSVWPRRTSVLLAGTAIAVAIGTQWTAFDLIEIATATSIMQISVPIVVVTAPLIVGTDFEKVTLPLVIGTMLVVGGSVLTVLSRAG